MGLRGGSALFLLGLSTLCICLHAQSTWSPADNIFIASGSTTDVSADGRLFAGDAVPAGLANPKLSAPGGVLASTSVPNANLPNPKLYQQSRIFTTNSSYTFTVTPGRHFIRLHFFPFVFTNFTPNTSTFSVTANEFMLLDAFRPSSLSTDAHPLVFREYSLNTSSNSLVINFAPAPTSFAFVNAIEVSSMPDDLVPKLALSIAQPGVVLSLSPTTAVEMVYHVNVGGGAILPANDSQGLWRNWQMDDAYLYKAATGQAHSLPTAVIQYLPPMETYIAPPSVYNSARTMGVTATINAVFNITWIFPVDLGFSYFVRLHFCELLVNAMGERIFNVYVNNQTAATGLDIIQVTGQANAATYRDYIANMETGANKLWLQIGPVPSPGSTIRDVILNGIEIWKLNSTEGSLSGGVGVKPNGGGGGSEGVSVGAIAGAGVAGVVAVALIGVLVYFCCWRKKSTKLRAAKSRKHAPPAWLPLPGHHATSDHSKMSAASGKSGTGSYVSTVQGSNLGRYFTFAELQDATNNFDESLILGVGGFGKVFKGEIDDGTKVAVKRGNPCSEQGLTEFQTEIELLSKLRHRHLVSLIGYCEEHCEMILVYDYMAEGPLRGHLYGTELPALGWKQRLEICIGAARGLHYLHTGAAQGIIHRDVKTTNILLDENLVAKVADFGLSKTGPSLEQTHISTAVKGSFGYLDPEYFRRQQLTEKSDVYSFGVVLMEVLCARPAINPALSRDQVNLAEWALQKQKQGLLETIMDPRLVNMCNPASIRKFGETAEKCLQEQGVNRPAMGDVLWNLEHALQLHEASLASPQQPNLMDASAPMVSLMPQPMISHPLDDDESSVSSERHILGSLDDDDDIDLEDASASAVFSQLVNPKGR